MIQDKIEEMQRTRKKNFTNIKMIEIKQWDFNNLRNTKEYQEKRLKFIEKNGGKCLSCGGNKYLTISHPQEYVNVIFSRKTGKFYTHYYSLKYKECCPRCYFDKAFEELVKFKLQLKSNGKKRRTDIKFKYRCANCGNQFKYPRRKKENRISITRELNDLRIIPENYEEAIKKANEIQDQINKQQWKKYISFKDAVLSCRDCHYEAHFIPLINLTKIKKNY